MFRLCDRVKGFAFSVNQQHVLLLRITFGQCNSFTNSDQN